MKSYTPTQITRDHLLATKVGNEVSFIVPQNEIITELNDGRIEWTAKEHHGEYEWTHNQPVENFIEAYYPLQTQDKFFIAESYEAKEGEGFLVAALMTPEQSRFHGVVVDVRVQRINSWRMDRLETLHPTYEYGSKIDYVTKYLYPTVTAQHNELHKLSIEPSLDDYVFYMTARRTR